MTHIFHRKNNLFYLLILLLQYRSTLTNLAMFTEYVSSEIDKGIKGLTSLSQNTFTTLWGATGIQYWPPPFLLFINDLPLIAIEFFY